MEGGWGGAGPEAKKLTTPSSRRLVVVPYVQGTNSSLFLSRHDGTVASSSGQPFQAFRAYDGPEYDLLRGNGSDDGEETTALTPERVTFYMKVRRNVSTASQHVTS